MQQKNSLDKRVDLRQAVEYGQYMKSVGWEVNEGKFIKKIGWFRFVKWQRPNLIGDTKIKAVIIKIEPNILKGNKKIKEKLLSLGFKPDKSPMLPTKTIWLDLNKSEEQLLKKMHSKTRYNLKKQLTKARVIRGDKIKNNLIVSFYDIYKKNSRRQKFWGLRFNEFKVLIDSFSDKLYLLSSPEGFLIILVHDKTAYYSHNASTQKGRNEFVPTLLTWKAIKLAKQLGCTRFDFEGIYDKRYPITKKWRGFTRFKKGFGGKEVEYLGSFSKFKYF